MTDAMPLTIATVQAAVNGSPAAFEALKQTPHSDVLAVTAGTPLFLGRDAVAAVLDGLRDDALSGSDAQAWASFVRRGYVNSSQGGTRAALPIDYDPAAEDAIVEVVGRLDEIGDLIDGEVPGPDELASLRAALYT